MDTRSVSKLKKDLDSLFSKWVRLSHASEKGFVRCYTCGVLKYWKKIQNGHFISRQYLAIRFDPRNCRPQCVGCNVYGNGKQVEYARKLEAETPGITLLLYREAQAITKNFPYEEKILEYKTKLKRFKHLL